jgi:LmbE family N-acetylglucosaminyl deacetylase
MESETRLPCEHTRMARLMAVTAHPDDESFLFGGALAVHARHGDSVRLLCLTDGQAGRTGGLADAGGLGTLRREELRCACGILGIGEPVMPGLEDGGLEAMGDDAGTAFVRREIEAFDPDVLLTFGPDGASGHPDHKAAWRWTRAAAQGRVLYVAAFPDGYELDERADVPLPATTEVDVSELGDAKRRAFLAHQSQIDHLELFDRMTEDFRGTEIYHRVHPAWQEGAPRENGLLLSASN